MTRRWKQNIPLPGDSQKRADFLRLARAAKYQTNRQVETGESPFAKRLLSGAAEEGRLRALADSERISVQEARRRAEAARRDVAAIKKRYRGLGLYDGDASGDWDPLLNNAFAVQHADDVPSQDRAIEQYVKASKKSTSRRSGRIAQRAARAQHEMRAMLNQGLMEAMDLKGMDAETQAFLADIQQIATKSKVAAT